MNKKYMIIVWSVLVVILLAGVGVGGYFYWKSQQPKPAGDVVNETNDNSSSEPTQALMVDWSGKSTSFIDLGSLSAADTAGFYKFNETWIKESNPHFGSRDLKQGDNGDDVKILQFILSRVKTSDNSVTGQTIISENGIFGTATLAAVKSLQADLGLEETGVVNNEFESQAIAQLQGNNGAPE